MDEYFVVAIHFVMIVVHNVHVIQNRTSTFNEAITITTEVYSIWSLYIVPVIISRHFQATVHRD